MFIKLLALEWKSFLRSASFGKSLGIKILIGFFVVYFGVSFLFLGLALAGILRESFPEEEPVHIVNRFLAFWFVGELFTRFMLQNLPILHIKPLLTAQIKKSTLVHFVLCKSLFHWVNFFPVVIFVPFTLMSMVGSSLSPLQLSAWFVALLGLSISLNYFNIIIQRKFADNLKALLPVIVIGLILALLEYFELFSSSALFASGFDLILIYPYLAAIPLVIIFVLYQLNLKALKRNLYLDQAVKDKSLSYTESDLSWTNRFGSLAPFLQMDMRLIRRNKRPRSMLMLSLVLIPYGLIFYPNSMYDDSVMLSLVGIFITGIFIMNFGQFIPSWDGGYFSMLMSQNIPMKQYLESKVLLMYISVLVLSILTIPYVYFGWNILMINLACAIYNLGINIPMVLFFGSYNKKKIDLDQAQFFNYQGSGAAQWLVGIPLILVPMLIWGGVNAFTDQLTASLVLSGLGTIGLLLKNVIMKWILASYRLKKYSMIDGFKQKG